MTNPSSAWNQVPVYGTWRVPGTEAPRKGTIRLSIGVRVTRVDGAVIYPAGSEDFPLGVESGSVTAMYPANDDPDITPQGFQIKVEELFEDGSGKTYFIETPLASLGLTPPGINLGKVVVPDDAPTNAAPVLIKSVPGGIAALDAQGDVVNAAGVKVLPGGTGGGGGTATPVTDAGALTGTLPTAVIADGSLAATKLVTSAQQALAKASTSVTAAQAAAAAPVQSVAGRSGSVVLTAVDVAGVATPASVQAAIAALVNAAPTTLDTLGEIATALQADESAAASLTALVGTKTTTAQAAAAAPVQAVAGKTGQVSLTLDDVAGLLNALAGKAPAEKVYASQAAAEAGLAAGEFADGATVYVTGP